MADAPKPFKRSPKRFQPRGLRILHEDRDIVVVDKRGGLLTMSRDRVGEPTAYRLLTDYVRKGNAKSPQRVFIVHRLDRDTSGVLVFARSEAAQQHLQGAWSSFQKTYCAVVHGTMPADKGVLASNLMEDARFRVRSVDDPNKGRPARTGYTVQRTTGAHSLLEIELFTGLKNQIRVHCADVGCPVVGDRKYGTGKSGDRRLALHAAALTITHPHSKQPMTFTAPPPHFFTMLMKKPRPRDRSG